MPSVRVAVVTGGNRGVGFATVKSLCRTFKGKVILAARNSVYARRAMEKLELAELYPEFFQLDLRNKVQRQDLRAHLLKNYGGLDLLVNNAGLRYTSRRTEDDLYTQVTRTLNTNFYGTLFLIQLLFPIMRQHARVVNLSSDCAFLSDVPSEPLRRILARDLLTFSDLVSLMGRFKKSVAEGSHDREGWGNDSYCISKVAVNALTFVMHRRLASFPENDMVVNSIYPGNVKSRMSLFKGTMSAGDAAVAVTMLATLPENTTDPAGQFIWHDLSVVDWAGPKPLNMY